MNAASWLIVSVLLRYCAAGVSQQSVSDTDQNGIIYEDKQRATGSCGANYFVTAGANSWFNLVQNSIILPNASTILQSKMQTIT